MRNKTCVSVMLILCFTCNKIISQGWMQSGEGWNEDKGWGGGVARGGSWVVERQHGTGMEGSLHVHRGPPHQKRILFFHSVLLVVHYVLYIVQYCVSIFFLSHAG
jgi:hypothetical protein